MLGLAGIALGLVSTVTGVFLMGVSGVWGSRVSASATGLAQGIEGAERAIAVLSDDLDGTTSLLGRVSLTVRQTSGVVQQTRTTLDRVDEAGVEMIEFSLLLSDDLEAVSGLLGPVGGGRLREPASRLRLAAAAGDTAIASFSGLRSRMGSLSGTLADVADSVDSLSTDLQATSSAIEEARGGLTSIREAMVILSTTEIASTVLFLFGVLLFFLGVQEILLGAILGRTGPDRLLPPYRNGAGIPHP